jgi:hypothetical protein
VRIVKAAREQERQIKQIQKVTKWENIKCDDRLEDYL